MDSITPTQDLCQTSAGQDGHTQMPLLIYDPLAPLPEAERPGTRLLRDGPAACSTLELLQVILGGPQAERSARELLAHCRDLRGILLRTPYELASNVHGLGEKKAALVKACLELGKRMMTQQPEARPQIRTPADAARLLMPEIGHLEQEEVWVMLLDARSRVIGTSRIYRGSLNSASMRVNELFREAICKRQGKRDPFTNEIGTHRIEVEQAHQ